MFHIYSLAYRRDQVLCGKRSLAIRIVYQSHDHTLTDEEVNSAQAKMPDALPTKLNAVLRG